MSKSLIEQASALYTVNDFKAAERICQRILNNYPCDSLAHSLLGRIAMRQNDVGRGIVHFYEAVKHEPTRYQEWVNLGCCHMIRANWDEAQVAMEHASQLNPFAPEPLSNLGVIWVQKDDLPKAVKYHTDALMCDPNVYTVYSNRAIALSMLGRFDECMADFERAIQGAPNYADAHWSRSLIRLLHGDFTAWDEYEWRWKIPAVAVNFLPGKLWDGSEFDGTLLVTAEQGYGDTIQFARYLPMVRERCRNVVFPVQPALMCLYPDAISIKEVPAYDAWVPLMSLPGIFRTDLTSIPAVGGIAVPLWKKCIFSSFQIGIAWQGTKGHMNDIRRSFHPRLFRAFARPGVQLISLQKGYGSEKLSEVDFAVETPPLDTFADTARIIAGLDLVITCDTVIAHLAGSIGVPTWIMLPEVPDWRWLLDREDSPWYPSVKLFRKRGSWEEVFERAAVAIEMEWQSS